MKFLSFILVAVFLIFVYSCSEKKESRNRGGKANTEFSSSKDKELRSYNLKQKEKESGSRTPCDTIALRQYIIDNYPAGDYLVKFDRTYTYNVPKEAVLYYKKDGVQYIFAVIAKSKPGERFIETNNVTGYESSFINLDSTKLGTAFFFLTLFECSNDDFNVLWEAEVPIHGGFNSMKMKTWKYKRTPYIQLDYEAGIISGHRDYNFFLVDGIRKKPHLMETYVGIVHKRTMANVNDDRYPDYYEYLFVDSTSYIQVVDSIPFYWDSTKSLYVTKRSPRWFRYY
ncbi:MAG: hypothetical protein GXO87_05625 [Chlorobi bacterium]|nr:hypothetical protein [Chlorobiota bacterium]